MPAHPPVLSICVPSRNRQIYFQETIRALTSSLRTDVEFVFCDNSDDPAIMRDFIGPYLADPRVVFVPSGETIRPMVDNWEEALTASSGRWIAVIGDDDYIDPDLAGLIVRLESTAPDLEALDWSKLYYSWPYQGKPVLSNPVHLNAEIHEVPKQSLMNRAFRWDNARDVLGCGFGIYHGAVSRTLMERIRTASDGRYFEHAIVDFDSIFKVIMHGKRFVHIRRPISVMGVCPASNSAAVANPDAMRKKQEEFDKEHASPVDRMDCYRDFPFHTRLGLAACILMTQHWFARKYGYRFSGYEDNFVHSCTVQCGKIEDRVQYDLIVAGYRKAFSSWKGGRYLKAFKPVYSPPKRDAQQFSGLIKHDVFVTDDHPAFATVKSFYDLASSLMQPIATLDADLGRFTVDQQRSTRRA
jgi:glycosyltransferase involved in cell wall biosynthesis